MKLINAQEVPKYINDGNTVLIPGVTNAYAENATVELAKSYEETGHPAHLKLYWQAAMGDMKTRGLSCLCQDGLFDFAVAGHINGCGTKMTEFCRDNKAEIYNFPQGVTFQLMRAVAAHVPGVLSKVGLKTFMDPRIDGGRMNSKAKEQLVELITIDGEECLFYKAPKKIDVALIRGTYADENGNLTMDHEGYKNGMLTAAAAARATGGIVIAQVERILKAGTMNPRLVEVPGILVDYVFCADMKYHMQTSATQFNPVFTGEIKVPLDSIPPVKFDEKKIMARRAAMELHKGDILNLGVGTPSFIASVAAEEGCPNDFTQTSETGSIGGVPGAGNDFGCHWNGEAMLNSSDMFDMYDGGGVLDEGCLGFLQVGPNGDVNSSSKNGLGIGVGGFMNVAGGAKKVIFMGAMTAGSKENSPQYEIADGKLIIKRDGNITKFVNTVGQISFSGEMAMLEGKTVLYITERAVFKLTKRGFELIEIAPGVDLEKDVLAHMEFKPVISEDLKTMPEEIFHEKWGGLKKIIEA